MRLQDKVALVTGGARGMGETEARLFASEGATVVIADVLAGEGREVAKQIVEAHGGRISAESPPKNQPDSKHHFSGTKVSFWIPLRAQAPREPHATPFHESAPEGGTS